MKNKNIIITLLIIVIIFLIINNLLSGSSNFKTKQIVIDSLAAQSGISQYIGKMQSDTFDMYTIQQLLIGSIDIENIETTKIIDNDNNNLLQIVSIENKISLKDSVFFKINITNFEKKFGMKLYKEDGITWYLQSTGDIKVSYTVKPSWWTQELDAIYIGN